MLCSKYLKLHRVNQECFQSQRYGTSQWPQIQELLKLQILDLLKMLKIIYPNYLNLVLEVSSIWYFKYSKDSITVLIVMFGCLEIFYEMLHLDVCGINIFFSIYNTLEDWGRCRRSFPQHQNLTITIQNDLNTFLQWKKRIELYGIKFLTTPIILKCKKQSLLKIQPKSAVVYQYSTKKAYKNYQLGFKELTFNKDKPKLVEYKLQKKEESRYAEKLVENNDQLF
ncbi:unnamed protein product [Paramecium octaurelia]|uniref:Uncharacterized protein n=1 Tax=Paramecium octaurelia TaxID=43137 RepID=A0A8S1Y6B1_PAROT|nr:unnamed protein product [Paramecium octaurelia]